MNYQILIKDFFPISTFKKDDINLFWELQKENDEDLIYKKEYEYHEDIRGLEEDIIVEENCKYSDEIITHFEAEYLNRLVDFYVIKDEQILENEIFTIYF